MLIPASREQTKGVHIPESERTAPTHDAPSPCYPSSSLRGFPPNLAPQVYQKTYQMLLLMPWITHWASLLIAPSRHTDRHSVSHFLCPSPTCAGPHQSEAQFWEPPMRILQQLLSCQYLYFCTSQASKQNTSRYPTNPTVSSQPPDIFSRGWRWVCGAYIQGALLSVSFVSAKMIPQHALLAAVCEMLPAETSSLRPHTLVAEGLIH